MSFGALTFTSKGTTLQAKSQTGAPLHFTRIAMGDGVLGQTVVTGMNSLIHEVKSLSLNKMTAAPDGQMILGAYFSNKNLAEVFQWREIGVFANDPELGEILYCYGSAGTTSENIPLQSGSDLLEKQVDVIVMIGSATNISATINESLVYASKPELVALKNEVDANNLKVLSIKKTLPPNYYVNGTTGNDNNDGLAAGTAFKTIMKAVDKIPSIVDGTVQINVADGTYAEDVIVNYRVGGIIDIVGNATSPSNVKINKFVAEGCTMRRILLKGFEATTVATSAFTFISCINAQLSFCKAVNSAPTMFGAYFSVCSGAIAECQFSNRSSAICVVSYSVVICSSNTGVSNLVGIQSNGSSLVSYVGTIPAATTPTVQIAGGIITNHINADTLDGIDASGFLKTGYEVITDGNLALDPSKTYFCISSGVNIPPMCQEWFVTVQIHANGNLHQIWHSFNTSSAETYERVKLNGSWCGFARVWNSLNDGIDCGLDADLWRGYRIFNRVSELGLPPTATVGQICASLPSKSIFEGVIDHNPNMPCVYPVVRIFAETNLDVFSIEASEFYPDFNNPRKWIAKYRNIEKVFSGWKELLHSGNYGQMILVYGSITLDKSHKYKILQVVAGANITITVPVGLDDFECTVISHPSNGAYTTTFVGAASVSIVSNPDNTKRTLNGMAAFAYIKKYVADTTSYIITGNLKA